MVSISYSNFFRSIISICFFFMFHSFSVFILHHIRLFIIEYQKFTTRIEMKKKNWCIYTQKCSQTLSNTTVDHDEHVEKKSEQYQSLYWFNTKCSQFISFDSFSIIKKFMFFFLLMKQCHWKTISQLTKSCWWANRPVGIMKIIS